MPRKTVKPETKIAYEVLSRDIVIQLFNFTWRCQLVQIEPVGCVDEFGCVVIDIFDRNGDRKVVCRLQEKNYQSTFAEMVC